MKAWTSRLAIGLAGCLSACALGYRGTVSFDETALLEGSTPTVILDLPDTDVLVSNGNGTSLTWTGKWSSFAGTNDDARLTAGSPRLILQEFEGVYRLIADIPLTLDGLVELELDEVVVPPQTQLEIYAGRGDVTVGADPMNLLGGTAMGPVSVSMDRGDVRIDALTVQVDKAGSGKVLVRAGGALTIESAAGEILAEQSGSVQDVTIRAKRGDVNLALLGDPSDVTYVIEGRNIRVQTSSTNTIGEGRWSATVGTGARRVEIVAERGDVLVGDAPLDLGF